MSLYTKCWGWSLLFCFGGNITALTAQPSNLHFERLGAEQRVPMGNFDLVLQDSRGFIWAGGYAGLVRYDGYEVVHYTNDATDSLSIGDNKVSAIVEGPDQQGLWVGTQNGLNYYDFKTETFTRYLQEQRGDAGNTRKYIQEVCAMPSGQLWVMTSQEIGIFNPADRSFKKIDPAGEKAPFLTMHQGQDGTIWVGKEKGLFKIDPAGKALERMALAAAGTVPLDHFPIYSIAAGAGHTLWLGSTNSIIHYDASSGAARHYPISPAGERKVRAIKVIHNSVLWCGTDGGLFRFTPRTAKWEGFQHDPNNANSLSSSSIQYIHEDHTGVIWLATIGGINVLRTSTEIFQKFPNSYQYEIANVSQIRGFIEIAPGKLLLWEKGGLKVLDWKTGAKAPFPHRPVQDLDAWDSRVYCFFKDDRSRIWMGTHQGVFVFDPTTNAFTRYHQDSGGQLALSNNQIRDICQDHTGAIWIATWAGGVNQLDEQAGVVRHFFHTEAEKHTYQNGARKVFVDRSGTVWAGTRGGLHRYDRERRQFKRYSHDPQDPNSIGENTAFDIYEDAKGYLWIGTYGGGLNRFDPATDSFRRYTIKDGLPDNNVFSVLPDDKGHLWLNTYVGIVKFDPEKETFQTIDFRDGLLNRQYEPFSTYRSAYSGELIYEGKQGIDIFHPDSIRVDSSLPVVRFTGFQLFNRLVPIRRSGKATSRDDYYLDQSISETQQLVIPYHMKVLTFQFAALHFANPGKNQYAYRLEGFDQDWQHIGHSRTATFTNLAPGKYRLFVKASNADGRWNEQGTSIEIIVTPPWWLTWWAWCLYLLAAAGLLYAFFNYQRRRWHLQAELAGQQREAQRLKELDAFKSQLYANFTHELRTPLTVILGATDQIPAFHQKQETSRLSWAIEMVRRNSFRLLQLINQILDLSKLEAGMMTVEMVQGNVVAFMKYLTESYESLAEVKGISIAFEAAPSRLLMDFDEEKLCNIFSNLLSNAIKFTPTGGSISIGISTREESRKSFLLIEVRDTGIGIPQDKLPYIFDRFYQVDSESPHHGLRREGGTGIGLTLTKELTELLDGKIEVESTEGHGTCFRVLLPVANEAPLKEEDALFAIAPGAIAPFKASTAPADEPAPPPSEDLPTLLIVEDSPDIISYLRTCLQGSYDVTTATNGRQGVEKAIEEVPDIIISDVMMPEMDGFELCTILKNDERTSHIPIVLLTARVDAESRLKGLQRGADAYLSKPFNLAELKLQLANLTTLQQKLRTRYLNLNPLPPSEDPGLQLEDQFLAKARQAVFDNLDDPDFSISDLYRSLGVSRTQLHNKLRALTGRSTSGFIRSLRLQRGRELLRSSKVNVSEIAYLVGFNDPNYFSRCYLQEYGLAPSEERGEQQTNQE